MNFNQLQETVWDVLGVQSSGDRRDCTLQAVKRGINSALVETARAVTQMGYLTREKSITLVPGTNVYYLDDWCRQLRSLYTVDGSAHKVNMRIENIADHEGLRNSTLAISGTTGPYDAIAWERPTTALKSGTVGAIAEGTTAFTKTGGDALDSTDVGRMLRINGEDNDYVISAIVSADACTIDRAHRGFLTGNGTTGAAASYTNKKWEVSPAGRIGIRLLPSSSEGGTLYYRGIFRPKMLVNADEVPELPSEFHDLIWKGALRYMALRGKELEVMMPWINEYSQALQSLKKQDAEDSSDQNDGIRVESLFSRQPMTQRYIGGVYWRGFGYIR